MPAKDVRYYFDEDSRFVIENYNWAKSFADFFPGIAGKWGIPIWCYYVNRNQGVCSMGIHNKEHQILEFQSFNKALASVGNLGFRTFMRLGDGLVYEPFQKTRDADIEQKMIMSSGELGIFERNRRHGFETEIAYYPLVEYRIPALVREFHLRNISDSILDVDLVDGLPKLFPYGMNIYTIQTTPRHAEGLMRVADYKGIPLFRLKQTPRDVEQVAKIEGGNFYFSATDGMSKPRADTMIVDPAILFGEAENYDYPWNFEDMPLPRLLEQRQTRQNRTPCAFTARQLALNPGEEAVIHSILGYVDRDKKLDALIRDASGPSFFRDKRRKNSEVLEEIKSRALTVTDSQAFDEYSRQTFLDNVIRGGMPLVFGKDDKKSTFYIYSKQNGDLERDYHFFIVEPTYLSQGTGHYRSILQNRRCDTWFFPEIGDFNIRHYLNLAQLDGYNPLEVNQSTYTVEDAEVAGTWLRNLTDDAALFEKLWNLINKRFTPGEFIMAIEDSGIKGKKDYKAILDELIPLCGENDVGGLHDLGFWVDHWCYNLDTIEAYLMIYPENAKGLLFEDTCYTFFDNPDRVLPRSEKCVLTKSGVRRYGAVVHDEERAGRIESRGRFKNRVRTKHGTGEVYHTNLFVKLLCLIVNRMATLDPENIGVEMEANKPGWNDSMSGLPGIFGSSLCQTFELERFLKFLLENLKDGIPPLCKGRTGGVDLPPLTPPYKGGGQAVVYEELAKFMSTLSAVIDKCIASSEPNRKFTYWDESNSIKEAYREKTKFGVSGREKGVPIEEVASFLKKSISLIGEIYSAENKGRVFNGDGICHAYMRHEVLDHEPLWTDRAREISKTNAKGQPLVKPLAFDAHPIALFLEGPVHFMRAHPERALEMYAPIRESGLFDKKLSMYKVCESLKDETFEIGRVHAWGPGWIENESIYTHMEYKYLLELLKCGLYDEFYNDIKTCLACFLDPKTYGRSTSENVSFVVSSAFPDEAMHGRGFQARLSGVTTEFLHIWTIMMAGPRPFFVEDGRLKLRLDPRLPEWLFTREKRDVRHYDTSIPKDSVAFNFLGRCLVVYHNPRRRNTWGADGARVSSYRLTFIDGHDATVDSDILDTSFALDVREGRVGRIDASMV